LIKASDPETLRKVACWPANDALGRSSAVAELLTATKHSGGLIRCWASFVLFGMQTVS